jgi:diguanylate cyclase (GGDEF)-like protein/PAS domain S-box-containing protein
VRDISARKSAEETLRESQERYELAMRGANDGLWDWNLKTDRVFYSPRWISMLGYSENEIGSDPEEWLGRIPPDEREIVRVAITAHLNGYSPHFEIEHRIQQRDGSYRWVLVRGLAVRDASNLAYRMAGSMTDITSRKDAEAQLLHDAFHDQLTGLPNRALFMDRLGRTIEHTRRREKYFFAVLFLDLDRFKVINDSLGHRVGDRLLVEIARSLHACLRAGDTVARLGGDEFVILLEDISDIHDATRVAKRVQKTLSRPFQVDQHLVFTSASIGIVLSTVGYDTQEDVLRDADIAMYQAKMLGKAQFVIFDTSMRSQAIARLELENDLRHALARRELELHYQPIVALKDEQIIGFEALLRWQHPARGSISPMEFIPIAEETGIIFDVGEWILREACSQMRRWQTEYPGCMSMKVNVNISQRQFNQPDLFNIVKQTLEETGLDANSLNLEITENMLMDNAEEMIARLEQLRALGVGLHIDDFGTGYSSLSYLQRFPIDTLKIDFSFINRIGDNGDGAEIVRTILLLARELGIDAIAEGVETKNQLEQLRLLECEYAQGFYFAKPLQPRLVTGLLSSHQEQRIECAAPEEIDSIQANMLHRG